MINPEAKIGGDDIGLKSDVKLQYTNKLEIFDKYFLVFGEIDMLTLKILPILLSRPYVLSKFETFYDKQFEEILRKKSSKAINFPKIVNNCMKSKIRENRTYFIQSLGNLIYSAEKYADFPEMQFFLEFILTPGDNPKLLYYLFVRQHFKILNYTTFISHYKTASDPSKIMISLEGANDIITVAFSHDNSAALKLHEAIKANLNQPMIAYYDLMKVTMGVRFIYRDLKMIDKAIALYRVTNFADLDEVFRNKQMLQAKTYQNESNLNNNSLNSKNQKREVSQEKGKEISINETGKVNRSLLNDSKNTGGSHEKRKIDMSMKTDPQNERFLDEIKKIIPIFSEKMVTQYYEKIGKTPPESSANQKEVILQIQKKLLYIVRTIFGEDRRRFLVIVRSDLSKDDGSVLDFWMDQQEALKESQRMKLVNQNIANEFIKNLFKLKIIEQQFDFLLKFKLEMVEDFFDVKLNL